MKPRVNASSASPAPAREAARGFALLLTGQTISNLGSAFTLFALPLLVYQRTGSALYLAATSAAEFLPYPLFGLWLGAIADRTNRKRLMIGTDLARAVVVALIPALAFAGRLTLPMVYTLAFVHTTLSIAFNS